VDHTSRLRNRIIGGMIAMALIPIASATGGAAAEGDAGDPAFEPAPALEGDVVPETLGGQEALAASRRAATSRRWPPTSGGHPISSAPN
jgi:hypothetical protein